MKHLCFFMRNIDYEKSHISKTVSFLDGTQPVFVTLKSMNSGKTWDWMKYLEKMSSRNGDTPPIEDLASADHQNMVSNDLHYKEKGSNQTTMKFKAFPRACISA